MTILSDEVFDKGLEYLTANAAKIHLCSSEPANFAAVAGVSVANADVTISAPADASPSGRKVTIPALNEAYTVTADGGNAAFYAITDGTGKLLVAKALPSAQNVYAANQVSTPELIIYFPDPT